MQFDENEFNRLLVLGMSIGMIKWVKFINNECSHFKSTAPIKIKAKCVFDTRKGVAREWF